MSSCPNKANACFVENHPFLDFFICILLKSPQIFFPTTFFLYGLGYFKKNIFDEIDNKVIIKWFQNIKTRREQL